MNPGQWSYVTIGDTRMLILSCPKCGQQAVTDVKIDFKGNSTDAIECPYVGCDFDEPVRLHNWTP